MSNLITYYTLYALFNILHCMIYTYYTLYIRYHISHFTLHIIHNRSQSPQSSRCQTWLHIIDYALYYVIHFISYHTFHTTHYTSCNMLYNLTHYIHLTLNTFKGPCGMLHIAQLNILQCNCILHISEASHPSHQDVKPDYISWISYNILNICTMYIVHGGGKNLVASWM